MNKLLAILLALAMTIGLLTACGNTEPANVTVTPAQSPEQMPVEIRIVGQFGGTDPTAAKYQQVIKDFMTANPSIMVLDESNTADESWKARVATDFSCENDPDVVQYFIGADAKPLIENKKVVSIEEIKKVYPEYAKDITDKAMTFMKEFDGNHYGVPVRGFYEGLFCNKDLFEKYDLELPTDWAKFETAIIKFAAEGVIPVAASFSDVPHYWIEHLVLAQGGILDHAINPILSYPESWEKGLCYLKTLKEMGAFPADVNATKNDIISNLFYDKKAAMIIDGSWSMGGIKDPDTTVVLSFPATPDGKKDHSEIIGGFSVGYYISTKAWNDPKKRDAAVKLVMHLTSRESIAILSSVGGTPAAECPAPSDLTEVMKTGLEISVEARFDMPIDSRISKEAWTYFLSQIGQIADGQITPKEVLTEVVNRNK